MKRSILATLLVLLLASLESTPAGAQTSSSLPYEVLYISGKIIYPSQITRAAGPFLLVIKNHSRLKKLVIHIKQSGAGMEVLRADLDDRNGNYDAVVNLTSGTYYVTEPGHPDLKCTLTITE